MHVLASEGIKNANFWYPTLLGLLVVISAIGLFVGSAYLLLATNVGARLGFLVTVAALSGMMMLLSSLWWTTASPLNTLKGRLQSWKPVETVADADLARSDIPAVQDINTKTDAVDLTEVTNVKAFVDQIVVVPTATGGEAPPAPGPFAKFQASTDYLVTSVYETGGEAFIQRDFPWLNFSALDVTWGGGFPWVHVTAHDPKYAVAVLCPVDKAAQEVPFGDPIPAPQCDTTQPTTALVLERDLGSVRMPPFVALIGSSILFALSLLGLHWRERDLREAKAKAEAASTKPVPVSA